MKFHIGNWYFLYGASFFRPKQRHYIISSRKKQRHYILLVGIITATYIPYIAAKNMTKGVKKVKKDTNIAQFIVLFTVAWQGPTRRSQSHTQIEEANTRIGQVFKKKCKNVRCEV